MTILLVKAFIYHFLTISVDSGPTPLGQILVLLKRGVFQGIKFYFGDFATPGKNERDEVVNPSTDPVTRANCELMDRICQSIITHELGG
jgi:hypothetical protein